MVSTENTQTSNIIQTEWFAHIFKKTHAHLTTINEERVCDFEREQEGYMGSLDGGKGQRNDAILILKNN